MKQILNSLNLLVFCVLCLFGKYGLKAEVYGTYNLIDGNNYNPFSQSSPSAETTQSPPSTQIPQTEQTAPPESTTKTVQGMQNMQNVHAHSAKKTSDSDSPFTTTSIISQPTVPTNSASQIPINRLASNYNPLMARKIGLSTLMMSGVLYGLTMLPALIAISGISPLSGLFGSLGRRKRSLVNESHIFRQLPLLNNEETFKFLKLFESTLASRKIESPGCKKYYTCKVYLSVLKSGEKPKLSVFESAIINVFGIAVERKDYKIQFIPTVKMYYNVAKDAIKGESCARKYPCPFQAYDQYTRPGL